MRDEHSSQRRQFLKSASVAAGAVTFEAAFHREALASGHGDAARRYDRADLEKWHRDMVMLGPRITGGAAHRQWIGYLETKLASFGLQPKRYPVHLKYWEATHWSLAVTDNAGAVHEIPVAFYLPYAGETTSAGVTAEVVDVSAGTAGDYDAHDVAGKIVLFDRQYPSTATAAEFIKPVLSLTPPHFALDEISFIRPFFNGAGGIGLKGAKQRGAIGAIAVMDLPPAAAAGQFSSHQQHMLDLPALNLSRTAGAQLRALMAKGPVTATLVLQANRDDHSSVDFLAVKLPGNGTFKGAVCVLTHTDGQNAIEENGGVAMLSMARHFSKLPVNQRPRDIYFLFSATHMKDSDAGVSPQAWLDTQPEIKAELAAVFTIEHLGAMEWFLNPDKVSYGPSGKEELWVVGVGNSEPLAAIAAEQIRTSRFSRLALTGPPGNFYGEGTSTYTAGLPSITTACGPVYLVQITDDSSYAKISIPLMASQTEFCTRVTAAMLASARF